MSSRLINVRLDPERLHKVQALRNSGVNLSDVVREAIDERFQQLQPMSRGDAKSLVRRIFDMYPDPAGLPQRDYDVHDRRSALDAILRRLRRT